MKKRITLINIITSLVLQVAKIASGFIIPKLILESFGSEVNGLVSSLTQFLTYTSLIEGGVVGVVIAALYRPLAQHDEEKISSILSTARRFYNKISAVCIVYTLILAIVYPLLMAGNFEYFYVFSLTIILSISIIIQMKYSLVLRTLLVADKKVYISSITQTIIHIVSIILAVLSIKIYPNVHLLKFLTGITFILQPLAYWRHIKKNYNVSLRAKENKALLKNRWDGFIINVANLIHKSTDVAVLTIFTDFTTVSIYSVYALVNTGIENAIGAIASSLNPTLGHAYAKNDYKLLNKKMDLYEYIIFATVSIIMSVSLLLIVPFVMIYTSGVTDANYYQPLFAIMLVISEAIHLIKLPHLNLAYATNKFKEISPSAFIEAVINIVVSVALVPVLGIIGVTIGTIAAMTFRTIYHVWYTKKIIPDRKQSIFYKKIILFTVSSVLGMLVCKVIAPETDYVLCKWIINAAIYTVVIGASTLLMSYIFFKKELMFFLKYLNIGKKEKAEKEKSYVANKTNSGEGSHERDKRRRTKK